MIALTGLSVKGIEKNIRLLKKEGLLDRIGPDKGGYWKIIENKDLNKK
jgi:ATP-dependent DNA helicase RecG